MELVTIVKGLFQDAAEYAAGYKYGQVVLRQADKALWVLEKTARWAVPPPIDQDETPQPELVRPLPWIFFLALLIILRTARLSVSVFNLFCGKPPCRSANVVMYIQSKRRYIRALKYQGNRNMRARSHQHDAHSWVESVFQLLEITTFFRSPSRGYGNNNTTSLSNNDESTKCSKRTRDKNSASDKTMELLIEKMMVNMNTDSEDDSSYTLTNDQSVNGDELEVTEVTDSEPILQSDIPTSTPLKPENAEENDLQDVLNDPKDVTEKDDTEIEVTKIDNRKEISIGEDVLATSNTEISEDFIKNEKCSPIKKKITPPKKSKIANGQAFKGSPKRKKGFPAEQRDSYVPTVRITPAEETTNNGTDGT